MMIDPGRSAYIAMPRHASTSVEAVLEAAGWARAPVHKFTVGALVPEPVQTWTTLRSPFEWYTSFYQGFIVPSQPGDRLHEHKLRGNERPEDFKRWLYRVTLGPPRAMGEPFWLPISRTGKKETPACEDHRQFYLNRDTAGGGLYTYVFRTMTLFNTIFITPEPAMWLDQYKALKGLCSECRPTGAHPAMLPVLQRSPTKPDLDAEMRGWITQADIELIGRHRFT
jgi:hypothetical protein